METYTVEFEVQVKVRVRDVPGMNPHQAVENAFNETSFHDLIDRSPVHSSRQIRPDMVRWQAGGAIRAHANPIDSMELSTFELDETGAFTDVKTTKSPEAKTEQLAICVSNGMITGLYTTDPNIKTARVLNEDAIPAFVKDVMAGRSMFDNIDNRMVVNFDKTLRVWERYRTSISEILRLSGFDVGTPQASNTTASLEILGDAEYWGELKQHLPRGPKQATEAELAKAEQEKSKAFIEEMTKKINLNELLHDYEKTSSREMMQPVRITYPAAPPPTPTPRLQPLPDVRAPGLTWEMVENGNASVTGRTRGR